MTTQERADLVALLDRSRHFLRFTVQNLTRDQATSRPVPSSELSLGGLIKHVSATEQSWIAFATGVPAPQTDEAGWADAFRMTDGETLEGLLADYEKVAARTDELVATIDLDETHPLPEAPWFEKGAVWSNRFVLIHLISEISQHAGHADILREAVDGQKTMG